MTEKRRTPLKRSPKKAVRMLEGPKGNEIQEMPVDELPNLGEGSSVEAGIGFSYQPYAAAKCTMHITLGCSQDTPTIGRAAHLAMDLARKYALDGMEMLRKDIESDRFHIPEEFRT